MRLFDLNRGTAARQLTATICLLLFASHLPPACAQTDAESRVIAYQSPVSVRGLFGRSANQGGLQSVGSISVSVEAIFGDIDDSDALIGSPDAPQVFGTQFFATSLAVLDGAHVGESTLEPGAIGQQTVNDSAIGVKARLNYRAANNGGIEFNGFWIGESERSWQRGVGGFNAGAEPTTVRTTASLPLNNGLGGGYAVPFDQFFKIGLTTNVSGLGADFAPVGFWWGAMMIQPTIGVKYVDMNESFGFQGADSGLSYTLDGTGVPVPDTINPPVAAFPPYQSFLDVTADNQLIGPAIGLNVSTSGHLFRFSSLTRAGGFFGETRQTLSGQGFGNGFAPGFDPTIVFADSATRDYGTAFFEQTLNLDIELLRLLPKFAPLQCDQSLVLRLGWSFLVIDRLTRPVESIVWDGFPGTPTLKNSKAEWSLQTWNVGLVFQY